MKRIRYYTMNSWNNSTAPAYNLKVYNVIPKKYQDKVYELMNVEGFYDEINQLIHDFDASNDYQWQAGFNGRSGGYLVLYRGGTKEGHKSICTSCGQRNYKTIEETDNNICGKCGEHSRINKDLPQVYTQPGLHIDDDEVPGNVKRAFRKLALDIVAQAIYQAKHARIETYNTTTTHKYITL